jgi:hypothetical protein
MTNNVSYGSRNKIREIVKFLDNKELVEKKMVEAMGTTAKTTGKVITQNRLEKLSVRGIGTARIEGIARQIEGGERREETVLYMMKRQIEGTKRDLKKLRREEKLKRNVVMGMVRARWMRKELGKVMKEEREKVWKEKKNKMVFSVGPNERRMKGEEEKEMFGNVRVGERKLEEGNFPTIEEEEEGEELITEGIEVDDDEREFLKLPKGMADNPKFNRIGTLTDIAIMEAKARFSVRSEGDEIKTKESEEEVKKRVEREDREAEAVRVRDGNVVRFAKMRVTSLKSCRRITIPGELKKKGEELKLKTFVGRMEEAVKKEEKRRNERGKEDSVLTEKQKRGKEKLKLSVGESIFNKIFTALYS